MMAVVAVVAMIAGAVITVQRRATRFRVLAAYHLRWMEGVTGYYSGHEGDQVHYLDWHGRELSPRETARFLWHAKLRIKYMDASSSPWLTVASDPPEPE
jgi:hypothetical protein